MMKSLVIGASGFLGAWLVDDLQHRGHHVTGLSRRRRSVFDRLLPPDEYVESDLVDADLDDLVLTHDEVYFLAGRASVPESIVDPLGDLDHNTVQLLYVLESLKRTGASARLVVASSAAVYGAPVELPMSESHPLAPMSPYGVAKLAAEHYVSLYSRVFDVRASSVRLFSVYGPGQRQLVVHDLLKRALFDEGPLTVYGAPDGGRDFLYVSDAVSALALISARAEHVGGAFNVASGEETSLCRLAGLALTAADQHGKPVEFVGETSLGHPNRWCAGIKKLESLGFEREVSLSEGLAQTAAWLRRAE